MGRPTNGDLPVHVVAGRGAGVLGRTHHHDVAVGSGNAEVHQDVQRMPPVQRQVLEAADRIVGVDVGLSKRTVGRI